MREESGEMDSKHEGPKYPEVFVNLIGTDGNAFAILGRVQGALRRHGLKQPELDEFQREATAGDYDHLIATVMRWVEVY